MDVERLDGSGSVRALLYSATVDNPHFWWGAHGLNTSEAAAIIAQARGPSGDNMEYLSNLRAYLNEIGQPDPHVEEIFGKALAFRRDANSNAAQDSAFRSH